MPGFRTRTALLAVLAATAAMLAVAARPPDAAAAATARPPALLLIFDEWPVDVMLGPDRRIDPVRYPNLAALARTSTWFPNASTVYDSTTRAIPAILDAKYPRKEGGATFNTHPRSIFDVFGRQGYKVVADEEATSICPPRWCRGARASGPSIIPALQKGRRQRLERFFARIHPGPPTLYVRHTLLPHAPYLFLPSGKQTRRGPWDPIAGMNGPPSFADPFLTQHNEQRLRLQIGYLDHQLGKLFAQMKRDGIFDKALIAITPDHGIASEVGVTDRRRVTHSNIDEIAPIPVFIKAPGQRRGTIDRSYIRTIDIVPTMADIVNFRMPYRADGRSAFSPATRSRRYVRMIKRDFSGTITVSARSMEQRRAALWRSQLKLFGSGPWASLFTGIGPNRALLGRQAATIPQAPATGVRAKLSQVADLRRVNASSVVLPAQVTGRISGGGRGSRRYIAVAVNGRIEAVARTFHLTGGRTESFAAMVPETSLHAGRNSVVVFEIAGGKLRLLATT